MKIIGAHVSINGGVFNAPLNAKSIGANGFAMFCKNQRQWVSKPLDDLTIAKFKENLANVGISPSSVLPHDGYLINLGHPNKESRLKSLDSFIDEINRVDLLSLTLLNFHPGSHLREISESDCLKNIANSINEAILQTKNVKLVIENTAGQGSNLGYNFEQIATIIDLVENKNRIGVCLDTCHLFASGYDIRDYENYCKTMSEFDKVIGYSYLSGMHLNDAKSTLGSRVDRHHSLGYGNIGLEAFKFIMNDPNTDNIPLILETIDETIWDKEISLLRTFIKENR